MRIRTNTNRIVVHCSATRPSRDIGAEEIRTWHVRDKGWEDIGYAAVIRRNGRIEFGRPFDAEGAHVQGHNATSVGICLIGGLYADGTEADDDLDGLFTFKQRLSLITMIEFLTLAYPSAERVGHRDLSPDRDRDGVVERNEWLKSCPGFDVAAFCKRNGI